MPPHFSCLGGSVFLDSIDFDTLESFSTSCRESNFYFSGDHMLKNLWKIIGPCVIVVPCIVLLVKNFATPIAPIEVRSLELGDVRYNDLYQTFELELVNPKTIDVRIVGVRASCDCVVPSVIPFTLSSNSVSKFPVQVKLSELGAFEQSVVFITDHQDCFMLTGRISGFVK
jgi:hypothetical protein